MIYIRIWQGYTGLWWWQLEDVRGGILNCIPSGNASSKQECENAVLDYLQAHYRLIQHVSKKWQARLK